MTPALRSRTLGQIVAPVKVKLDDLDNSDDVALVVDAGASHYVPVRRGGSSATANRFLTPCSR